jgi:hypothetical protein
MCSTPSGCGVGEFGPNCDAGTPFDSGHVCGDGEFGPNCDAGTPPPPPPPPPPPLCTNPAVNTEPGILAGYSPGNNETVGTNGQIKVWITDECPAFIAPNEVVDPMTGKITTPGDRTSKAADTYLNEPALYIAPMSADNGGTPYFPQWVKGDYNNMPPAPGTSVSFGGCRNGVTGTKGPTLDPAPPGSNLNQMYNTEFVWDVSALGLKPGAYTAEFLIHDGDRERAVGCITIIVANTN